MIDYIWTVTSLEKTPQIGSDCDVIIQTYWNVTAKDQNGNTASFDGATPIDYTPNCDFVDYDQITEQQVLEWIHQYLIDNDDYEILLDDLADQLEQQKIIKQWVSQESLPWKQTTSE